MYYYCVGSIDGNPSNDFTKRDGSTSFSAYDFVKSYEVSGQSQCHSTSVRTSVPRRSGARGCRRIWGRHSQLSQCFSKVDPQPFGVSIYVFQCILLVPVRIVLFKMHEIRDRSGDIFMYIYI